MKLELDAFSKRMKVRSVLVLSIESGRIAVGLVRQETTASQLTRSFSLPVSADALLAEPEKAGQQLASHLDTAGVRERRAVICLPANWALVTSTEVPPLEGDDLRGYLELRAEREFPVSASELRLAHCRYVLPGGSTRATIAGVPVRRMEAVERFLAAAGVRAQSISLGLDACVPRDATEAALHFLANGTHVDLVVAAGGGIAAVRTLPGTRSGGAAFDADSFSREVRITLGRLPQGLREQVREARFAGTPETAEELCVEIRQQLRRLGIDSRLERATDERGEYPGAAVEAARRFLGRTPAAFEFLPPQVNRWQSMLRQFDDKRRRWLVAAAAAAVVIPILTFVVRSRMESNLTEEWRAMSKTVGELESLQGRIRQFRAWFESTPQALGAIEGLIGAFPESGDVWAKSVQFSDGTKLTCSGFARSQGALMSVLGRLRERPEVTEVQVQQMRGDNPLQFSFTCRWGARDAK